ncbi:MAG: hypothetical protein JO266_10365, partial [Acidobacteria bacterium]|nr:hypothetical protein [Acidobacteriota bacterium]
MNTRCRAVVVPLLLIAALASAPAQEIDRGSNGAIDCTHLVGWVAGGISSRRLAHLVEQHGIAFVPGEPL